MTYKLRSFWKFLGMLFLGFILGVSFQGSSFLPDVEFPFGQSKSALSPGNWVSQNSIEVYSDRIIIYVDNPMWATFTPTNSMNPVLDVNANALQVTPIKEKLQVGDIISYSYEDIVIIHRIVEIGNDGEWYAYTKGDNNSFIDPEKVRFEQIQKVLFGIIY